MRLRSIVLLAAKISVGSTLLLLFALCFSQMKTQPAKAADDVCYAAIVLDRSGSVQNGALQTMKDQVSRLFQAPSIEVSPTTGGLYTDRVQLAFWTFANLPDNTNYNAPFNGFVSTKGTNSSFNTNLYSINRPIQGQDYTNYMHGMGYVGNQINTKDGIDKVINQAEIIVFMTDGEPNKPSNTVNPAVQDSARNAGRAAAKLQLAAGKKLLGGFIQGATQSDYNGHRELNYLINGDFNNYNDTFDVNKSYNNLAQQLKTQIGNKCGITPHPCPTNPAIPDDDPLCKPPEASPYSLTPTARSESRVISGSDSAGFTYTITNNSTSTTSRATNWSVKRLVVPANQSVEALNYNAGESYRDGYSCTKLLQLINNAGTCNDSGAQGNRAFPPGTTTLSSVDLGQATSATVDDSWAAGTKLCYVLSIDLPTQNDSPTNRYGQSSCVVVGKRPTFQVHGGDIVAGKYFQSGDASDSALADIRGSVTTKVGNVNKTFGSWGEYGVFAPGVVSGVASGSGLADGYPGAVANSQDLWSRLTFSNMGDYGKFTTANGIGQATTTAQYFLQGRTVVGDLATANNVSFNGGGVQSGLYQKTNGNLLIDQSTLEKGKTVIVNVPNGTATITGNLSYTPGPYTAASELPQLIIIAKNIVINRSVTNVDAWLIAQDGTGAGGVITTCDVAPTDLLTIGTCSSPLVVNGPVSAKQMLLKRTGGSGVGGASGDPAEVFNLRADAYLWGYNEGRSTVRAETTYTKELPPQF